MTHEVRFLRTARNEFDRASTWYDQQRAGLGNSFISAIAEILDRVSQNVNFYPQVFLDVREAVVSRFPYCVYYRAVVFTQVLDLDCGLRHRCLFSPVRCGRLQKYRRRPLGPDKR